MNRLKKMLMGGVSILLLFASVSSASAQPRDPDFMSERRIFLWDVTISMVGATKTSPNRVPATPRVNPEFKYSGWDYDKERDVFDDTRASLCKMIDDISDESCEIIVVPYTDKETMQPVYMVPSASAADKAKIKNMINGWNNLKPAGTDTGYWLDTVVDQYFTSDKINRVILLTDGRADDSEKLYGIVRGWDCNKKTTRYYNNRLTYVMLTDLAKDQTLIDIIVDNNKDVDTGTDSVDPDENIADVVKFALGNKKAQIYVNEYASGDVLPNGGVIVVGCKLKAGPSLGNIVCHFNTDGSDYITVSKAAMAPDENGNIEIPFYFTGSNREYYRSALASAGGVANVKLQCVVDPACKNIKMEGMDVVDVEIIVRDEPRATISLSTK